MVLEGLKLPVGNDIGLSSSISYDFNVVTAVDILTAALDMLQGKCVGKNKGIVKFVLIDRKTKILGLYNFSPKGMLGKGTSGYE